MQSLNNSSTTKVKLSIGIVAITALFGAVVVPFLFRRLQTPTQQIDITPLNKAISDLTSEIHNTKVVLEKIEEAQKKQVSPAKKVPFRQKLFSSEYYKPTEVIQIIISIIGFGAVIVGLLLTLRGLDFTNQQLQASAESLSLAANQNIMSHTLDVDKLFIDSPELRPYFFDGVTPPNKDYNKAAAVAVYQLDFFDTFFGQSGDWLVFQNDPVAQDAWMQYFHDSFRHSPIMCVQLKRFANEYTPDFVNLFKGDCRNEFGA